MSPKTSLWLSPTLSDGIGNRFFQLAAATAAAKQYNRTLVFFLPRCYKASHSKASLFFRLFPSIPLIESGYSSWTEIGEKAFATYIPFNEEAPNSDRPVVIKGFRQSPKYFTGMIDLCPNFESAIDPSILQSLRAEWIRPDTAFLHVRLGDYLILPHHRVDLSGYWQETLQKITAKHLLIFSDSIDIVKTFLPFFQQFPFESIRLVDNRDPIQNLYLMSLCTGGAVCANSTFSWWGAYFAHQRNPTGLFFMPRQWVTSETLNVPDIYPDWATVV